GTLGHRVGRRLVPRIFPALAAARRGGGNPPLMRALYLLLGDPVAHSRSPAIHARAFQLLGVDAVYAPCRVTDPARAVEAARVLGVAGVTVTVPHHEALARLVDTSHPTAARTRAVNCLPRQRRSLIGHHTHAPVPVRA